MTQDDYFRGTTVIRTPTTRFTLLAFLVVLVLAWICYRPALGGAFQLDDIPNLGGLAQIEDVQTASNFVLSGESGPTGRPLSLLTFALQADQFEKGPKAFLKVNILIHLMNSVLLALCLYQLSMLMSIERDRAALIAVTAASLWLLLPLLATSSLLIVQRVTTLSAFFSFLGLGGYLAVRRLIEQAPRNSLVAMTAILGTSTLLATLSKESGFLLPVFVLVIETTVLTRPSSFSQRSWRTWLSVVLVLPAVVVIVFAASRSTYPEWMQLGRGFSGWERLLTESQILWLYLQKAVIGVPVRLGIYQTEYPISRSLFELKTLVSVSTWLSLLIVAIMWRRKKPLLALAVLWFLGGHMMESTVLSLEIYFEHRNYVPIVGPIFALCACVLLRPGRAWQAGLATITLFILVNAYLLFAFASIWGQPSVAARFWALSYPDSSRAATNLATYQLTEEGPQRAIQTIRQFTAAHPEHAYMRIPELNISCLLAVDMDREQTIADLERDLPGIVFTLTAGTMLSELFTTSTAIECQEVTPAIVRRLAILVQQNDRYINHPTYNQFHYKLLAGIARFQGDRQATITNLEAAISYGPSTELNMMMVTTLAGAGDYTSAENFISNAMLDKPLSPLKARVWQQNLEELRTYVRELEKAVLQDQEDVATPGSETEE